MSLLDLTDHYEVLSIKPDASAKEIREAYFRVKATYQKDNVALYTLIDSSEREEMLQKVEEAYQILSNPEKRKNYDRFFAQLNPPPAPREEPSKLFSIVRTPPMESSADEEDPLEAPETHFEPGTETIPEEPPPLQGSLSEAPPTHAPAHAAFTHHTVVPAEQPRRTTIAPSTNLIENEIREQTEWSGAFLRKVRESRGVSIEELTQATKITKAYVLAIEEENYTKLPAPVFIRGFVSQLARLLKLPHQQVAAAYMTRIQRAHPEKFN